MHRDPSFTEKLHERLIAMIKAARIVASVIGLATSGESVALAQSARSSAQTAHDEPVLLTWVSPADSSCPNTAYVLAEIRRYVGTDAAGDRAPISATATIRADEAGGFRLILRTTDGETSGERRLQDESCRALADAAVVVLAWMVAPQAMANRSSPPQAAAAHPVPMKRAEFVLPSTHEVVGPTPYLGLSAAVDAGTLPDPALGAEAWGGLSVARLRFEARAAYWPTRRRSVAALANGEVPGATFTLGAVGLHACLEAFPEPFESRFELALCVGPEVDAVKGAGFGVTVPAKASKTWVSLTAGIEGRVALVGRVKVFLSLGGVVPTEREHFALKGVGEIYRPSSVAARGTIGFELKL